MPDLELDDNADSASGVDAGWGDDSSSEDSQSTRSADNTEATKTGTESDQGSNQPMSPKTDPSELATDSLINDIFREYLDEGSPLVPGTNYSDLPYVFKRTGSSEKRHYDRDQAVNFNIFEETHSQLKALEQHINEVEYPDQNISRTDLFNAALIVGIYNPKQVKQVLDAWGFEHLSGSE